MIIAKSSVSDGPAILEFFKAVANQENGIARRPHEVTDEYIANILDQSSDSGLSFVGKIADVVMAEVHAAGYGIEIFDHILCDLTIAVHPDYQGRGYGRRLFSHFLKYIEAERNDIWRVELESRASNVYSIRLYESLGFALEGVMKNKTKNIDGTFEDSLMYAWFNQNFKNK